MTGGGWHWRHGTVGACQRTNADRRQPDHLYTTPSINLKMQYFQMPHILVQMRRDGGERE